jgi:PPK2 family polyphosphate:nucleotide phosphotransferase
MKLQKLARRFRVDKPASFRLKKYDPGGTGGLSIDKPDAKDMLADGLARLSKLQERFYADGQWALLIVLQGIDAAGKDGIIEHVMSAVDPQGCDVHPFKEPSAEELAHDFLWRAGRRLPERGHIGIFNRSYYEEVLVVRVHPELLEKQKLPKQLTGKDIWQERFEDIRAFERHLARSGTPVLKFFLHVSKEEQRKRFLDRIEEPAKRWKFSMHDIEERKLWAKYMAAYEDAIRQTSRPDAPWFIVPADHKWFTRLVIAAAIIDKLEALNPKVPEVRGETLTELRRVRKALESEKPKRGRGKG